MQEVAHRLAEYSQELSFLATTALGAAVAYRSVSNSDKGYEFKRYLEGLEDSEAETMAEWALESPYETHRFPLDDPAEIESGAEMYLGEGRKI